MTDFVERYVTIDEPFVAYDLVVARLVALFTDADERAASLADASFGDWSLVTVRQHIVDTLEEYAAVANGRPERAEGAPSSATHHTATLVDAAARAREAFGTPGVLDGVLRTQIGPQPGRAVFQHVLNELIAHGWDLGRCVDRTIELPDHVVDQSRASWQAFFDTFGRPEVNFAPEIPTRQGVSAIDRLAAYLGRSAG